MANVLGISCHYHDAAAALLVDGEIVACAEEERFSRLKHDQGFPENAILFCLAEAGLDRRDIDLAVFYENPKLKLDRILHGCMRHFPRAASLFTGAVKSYLGDHYWVMSHIRRFLGCPNDRIIFSEHHLSHACSAFFASPFEEAAIVTIDGVGEWNTATIAHGQGNQIRKIAEVDYPHSVGLLYSAFTAFLGFEVNEGEYKVMGLAPYGEPSRLEDMRKLVKLLPGGRFEIDLDYFSWEYSTERLFTDKFTELFGNPRPRRLELDLDRPGEMDENSQRYADIAASAQVLIEEIVLHIARHAHEATESENLCLAGGVALNSVANHRIREEVSFSNLFVQPAAGDSGGALGAALYGHHVHLGAPRLPGPFTPYLGTGIDDGATRAFLEAQAVPFDAFPDEAALCKRVAHSLAEGKVIGWCQGRSEWGPRALGNRSILADPAHPDMKEIINAKVKFREPFRPFAPAVLEESLGDFFEDVKGDTHPPLYYMLEVLKFRDDKRDGFPAVVHVDGSGRVQAVSRKLNPLFWSLISEFGKLTGVPMLLNTSFNVRGQPMVDTPAEAFETFLKTDIDELAVGGFLVSK